MLSLLETGGVFYTMVQRRAFRGWQGQTRRTWYQTELVDAASRDVKVCSWLKKTTCAKCRLRVEERLEHAHRADKDRKGLQRRLRPAHETIEVRGGESSRKAIPIGAVGW